MESDDTMIPVHIPVSLYPYGQEQEQTSRERDLARIAHALERIAVTLEICTHAQCDILALYKRETTKG